MWDRCSLCEQQYHGVVACALGWACWKTYVGRPETDWARVAAMNVLGTGLTEARQHEEALSVREAELFMLRRLGMRVVRAAFRAREELVRLREAAIRLREEEVLHEDRAAAARAVFDALSAEIEASRLENARAALRARETPPPSLSPSESA